ncbi:MAG: hypothetical protein ACRBCT_07430 [Alphaproteobacteria bacterium]
MTQKQNNTENGNALWFILIAVVLLGLLTMVLSRGGSSTDQTGDFEQLRVQAAEILRTAKSIEAAVQEMELRGVSENDISFENTTSTTDYTNANCDTSSDRSYPTCQIFNVGGAGLTYKTPSTSWLDSSNSGSTYYGDWLFTGNTCIPNVGEGVDASCNSTAGNMELMIILPYITQNLCNHINRTVSAPTTSGTPPADDGNTWTDGSAEFAGTFGNSANTLTDNPIADIDNIHTGCFEGGGTPAANTYHFYHVLKAR